MQNKILKMRSCVVHIFECIETAAVYDILCTASLQVNYIICYNCSNKMLDFEKKIIVRRPKDRSWIFRYDNNHIIL